MDLHRLTALEISGLLASGDVDALEVCEYFLARSESEAARHAFIALTPERARAEARASADRHGEGRPLGPLDGVPVAWKDLFDVRGTPTTAGSATRRDAAPAREDAPAVANLTAAGVVCLGKTNLTELAFSGLGLNPHFGTPRNPFGTARIPGGSSSGSAVAVAVGAVPCAIGTDTSGSVRIPAAFCGLVGFKPTATRIDRHGVLPLAPTLDSVGPLARSVRDVAALDAALRGLRPDPRTPPATETIRLVVPDGELVDGAEPSVRARFDAALGALEAAGATVERRPLRALEEGQTAMDAHGTIVVAEANRTHAALAASEAAEAIDPRVLARIRAGADVLADGYRTLLAERARLQDVAAGELQDAFVVYPTVRHTAPELAPLEQDAALFARVNLATLRGTMLASFLDLPGVSLPIGHDDGGLPIGMLLSAAPGGDDRVLNAALAVEAVLGAGTAPDD
jgi:aspartyl-tRNA(Asn)/glutamyl-tRNA(Gln) amidotransferase subunit A